MGARAFEVSFRLGEALCVLAAMGGTVPNQEATLDLSKLASVACSDHASESYMRRRFDPNLSEPAKLLLLLIESDVNLARYVFPVTGMGHELAVFRAKFVVAWHTLSALQQILDTHPRAIGEGATQVRTELNRSDIVDLMTRQGSRAPRNQCVHYTLRHDITHIDMRAPMFGLVEVRWEGQTYLTVQRMVDKVLDRLSDLLHEWRA